MRLCGNSIFSAMEKRMSSSRVAELEAKAVGWPKWSRLPSCLSALQLDSRLALRTVIFLYVAELDEK